MLMSRNYSMKVGLLLLVSCIYAASAMVMESWRSYSEW